MLTYLTNQISWLLGQNEPRPINAAVVPAPVDAPAFDANSDFAAFKTAIFQADKDIDSDVLGHLVAVNDQGEAAPLHNATLAALAGTSREMNRLFQPKLHERAVIQLVQHVAYGNEDSALAMVKANPKLLAIKVTASQREHASTVKTYSGKIITGVTAFQVALCEGDEVMAEKLKAIYLAANPTNGLAELDAQFNEIFPNGYAAHLEAQKQDAEGFEREVLNPLVDVITNATAADLQAALDKLDNNSALCQTLKAFKEAFNALSHGEKVYNPQHLLKVFEKYNAQFDAWYVNDNNPDRWLRLDLFWRQVIGWEQRYMAANYAQSFCTGLGNMVDINQPLQRIFNLKNYATGLDINFFPLVVDSVSLLGSDFGICSYTGRVSAGGPSPQMPGLGSGLLSARYKTYVEQKQQTWEHYGARIESSRRARVSSSVR